MGASSLSQGNDRRTFLRTLLAGCGFVGAALLGFVPVLGRWFKRLRPPGALTEKDFLSACIKCGQCVQVCPVSAIKLADAQDGFGVGTPFIDPRAQACDFSCDAVQCVLACPTGALTHAISYPHEVKIAVAELVRPHACLAVKGEGVKGLARGAGFAGRLRYAEVDRWSPIPVRDHPYDLAICDLCIRQCPIEILIAQYEKAEGAPGDPNRRPPRHAIRMVEETREGGARVFRPQVMDGCVGCGVCEMICPAEPAAIEVVREETRGQPA